ncbi:pH-sensitive chloride channel 2 isoform X2 [Halyomorpha halys]|uniref:pH-sensitive chloride channel 2 isoform X2 n=1 Tax=Halyomorpha halys TaxID=286706 RepID=UPI0006D505B6|nr:gamma-aminobutyric acid receptor subunit delta-like isoform X2 [Halyomorpha halys]
MVQFFLRQGYLKQRIMTSMVCLLDLGKFPFDEQICHLIMDGLTNDLTKIQLVWDEDTPLQIDGLERSLVEFNILALKKKTSEDVEYSHKTGQKFSTLVLEMKLTRHFGHYLLNYYLPSELLVIISWFSFWIDPAIVPARVTVGVSTMLTFILLDMTGESVPRASEFMANDLWFLICTAFMFLSLAEFAFVNSIDRKQGVEKVHLKKLSSKYILRGGVDTAAGRRAKLRRSSSCPSSPEIRRHFARNPKAAQKTFEELKEVSISLGNLVLATGADRETKIQDTGSSFFTMTPQEIANWIDVKSRIVFPLAFVIFNVVYWVSLIVV